MQPCFTLAMFGPTRPLCAASVESHRCKSLSFPGARMAFRLAMPRPGAPSTVFTSTRVPCELPATYRPVWYSLTPVSIGTGDMPEKVTSGWCNMADRQEAVLQDLVEQMSLYPPDTIFFLDVWCFGWEDVVKEVARHFDSLVSWIVWTPPAHLRFTSTDTSEASTGPSSPIRFFPTAQPTIIRRRGSTRVSAASAVKRAQTRTRKS